MMGSGPPLSPFGLYSIVRARLTAKFGKAMAIHDFRRAGPTYLAMAAPEKIGLIPGILQHGSPEVGEQHYNLARSMEASRRFGAHLAQTRNKLRLLKNQR
jgi:integrase/recombinase XerD